MHLDTFGNNFEDRKTHTFFGVQIEKMHIIIFSFSRQECISGEHKAVV